MYILISGILEHPVYLDIWYSGTPCISWYLVYWNTLYILISCILEHPVYLDIWYSGTSCISWYLVFWNILYIFITGILELPVYLDIWYAGTPCIFWYLVFWNISCSLVSGILEHHVILISGILEHPVYLDIVYSGTSCISWYLHHVEELVQRRYLTEFYPRIIVLSWVLCKTKGGVEVPPWSTRNDLRASWFPEWPLSPKRHRDCFAELRGHSENQEARRSFRGDHGGTAPPLT